jgi:hypothetical protein
MQLFFLKGCGLHTAKLLFSGETVFGGRMDGGKFLTLWSFIQKSLNLAA